MTLDSLLADERDLGYGAGLSFVAPLGVTQAMGRLMRDFGPVDLPHVRALPRARAAAPDGLLQPYFSVDDAVTDLSEAGAIIDFFDLAPLHVRAHRDQRSRADRASSRT